MKVSEDRFPLLFVYMEDQEEEQKVRARSLTRGASVILGQWPQYLTFVSYMSLIGLLSLLVCFVLSVFVVSLTAHKSHNPRRFSLVKCEEPIDNDFQLRNFNGIDADNVTFIVDVDSMSDNRSAVASAIESFLALETHPVYHVRLVSGDIEENGTIFGEFRKRFENYKVVTVRVDDFFRGTSFADSKNRSGRTLSFLGKVLIAWNFGGIILDSDLIALSNFRDLLAGEDSLVMGLIGPDNVLVSAKRVCHSFIFSIMKYMTKEESATTPAKIIEFVYNDFCSPGRNCSAIHVVSEPYFCKSEAIGCVFTKHRNASSSS